MFQPLAKIYIPKFPTAVKCIAKMETFLNSSQKKKKKLNKMLLKTMLPKKKCYTHTLIWNQLQQIIKWENVRSKRGLSFDIKWARSNRNHVRQKQRGCVLMCRTALKVHKIIQQSQLPLGSKLDVCYEENLTFLLNILLETLHSAPPPPRYMYYFQLSKS